MLFMIIFTFFFIVPSHSQLESVYSAKESFRELIEQRGLTLEEHHFWSSRGDNDQQMVTVHRVVPSKYEATNYNQQRKPLFLVDGILSGSCIFYIGADFLQSNGSFCAHHFGLCLLFTESFDLWILNDASTHHHLKSSSSADDLPATPKYISLSDNADQMRPFWLSRSLASLSTADRRQLSSLVATVTAHHRQPFLVAGYSAAADSMFALLSVEKKNEPYWKPFVALSEARQIGHSAPGVKVLGTLFTRMPGIYVPREGVQNFLQQISSGWERSHNRYNIHQKITKICSVLLMKEDTSGSGTAIKVDSSGSSSSSVTSSSDSYAAVTFSVVLLTGTRHSEWPSMVLALQQLVEVLRDGHAAVIDYGCLTSATR